MYSGHTVRLLSLPVVQCIYTEHEPERKPKLSSKPEPEAEAEPECAPNSRSKKKVGGQDKGPVETLPVVRCMLVPVDRCTAVPAEVPG